MSKSIRSYNELLAEKQRMELLLAAQKELVRYDLAGTQSRIKTSHQCCCMVRQSDYRRWQ